MTNTQSQEPRKKKVCESCDLGPCDIFPKVYDKCPVCGCPSSFTVKAMEDDIHLQSIGGKEPALFAYDKDYETPNGNVRLKAVCAICAKCGVLYTLARDKMKSSPLFLRRRP